MDLSRVCHTPLWFFLESFLCPQKGGLHCIPVVGQGTWIFNPGIFCVPVGLLTVSIHFHIGTVLPRGIHRFKFRFQMPEWCMPPSFKGKHGKIVYMLEAKISRSWHLSTVVRTEFKFFSKSFLHSALVNSVPQSGSVSKNIGVFSKGEVEMSATVNTKVCSPGDTLSVVAKICNSSSKKMRPKFSLLQRTVYKASGSTKTSDKSLCEMVGETIAQNSEETVSCQVKIPVDDIFTLDNCEIISVDSKLKVYLDISFAFDPEVVFPLIIVPSGFAALQPGEAVGPYPAGAFGAPSASDFPSPAFPTGAYPVAAGSEAHRHPAQAPTQHENIDGCNNKGPQQAPPHDSSTAASSTVQHQEPTASPQQGEDPPSYVSIFPPSKDPQGETGSHS
ncbi:arrestin domain-containing protein 3-like isoform X2 [Centropristis striata]|uniref:arrestin domain-containing protein 3-like isoform X2 n=1 Tax=Centropristis striata TaxID=184440 RepID=UPI0027DF4480|nr:arrestin domain-containing protein 3-like isoform X2 [Centropristis striata]